MNTLSKIISAATLSIFALGASPAFAAAVSVTETLLFDVTGEDLTFEFLDLAPSDGSGGTITIASGPASSLVNDPGLDLNAATEYFELFFDGASQGTFNCTGAGDHTAISGATVVDEFDCEFSLTIDLTPDELNTLIADANIYVGVFFSEVVHQDGDYVIVTLEYTAVDVTEVPLPAALPLFIAGIAGIGAVSRRRRSTKQKTVAVQ